MVLKLLLNTRMMLMIFLKILKNTKQETTNKKRTILIIVDDMAADILSNNRLNPIVTKLFVENNETFLFFLSHNLLLLYQKL